MSVFREQQRFPTRNYPYRRGGVDAALPPDGSPAEPPRPDTLYRNVVGLDARPRPKEATEIRELEDPFGRLLRSGKPFPLTLRSLLAAFDALAGTASALPDQLVFLVADGGHIPWTPETDHLGRAFRFAVSRGKGEFSLLVSASTALDSASNEAFLQIIGWDDVHEVFHFYERLNGTFFWAGMSPHALEDGTRGKGPFDSHVNGALVMKELRSPWVHWHAPQAGINEEALAPDDPLRGDTLFRQRVTAERLEIEVVRPAIRRWNAARLSRAANPDGRWRSVRQFLRQVVTDTTVNLASSETASHLLSDTSLLRPPLSFFINRDVLFDTLGLLPDVDGMADITIPGRLYRACLRRYDVHRSDGTIRVEGDSHFAFLVPEPAFEDTQLTDALVQAALLTARLAASHSMTDFPNPVFSDRRLSLLRHMPSEASGPNPGEELQARFVQAVSDAVAANDGGAGAADSAEREFLANWQAANDTDRFIQRIADYFAALRSGMNDEDVVDGWFRLAEYRRRRFRRRPLAEFALTTPRTTIAENAPALRMTELGRVEPVLPVMVAANE